MDLLETADIPSSVKKIELIYKWGCDESSGYSNFMLRPTHTNVAEVNYEENSDINGNVYNQLIPMLQMMTI